MECCLFETFRWDLKWDVLLETFETCEIYHGVLLIGNFQMRLEMRCAIRNLSNLFMEGVSVIWVRMTQSVFETFRWDLKWDVLFETFQTYHGGLLIWNFQMRLEMRCAIRNFSNLSWSVAYLKLSDDTWNEMCYLKLLKLFKPIMEGCLSDQESTEILSDETWTLTDVLRRRRLFKHWNDIYHTLVSLMWNLKLSCNGSCLFLDQLKKDVLFETWNFSNLSNHGSVAYWKLSDETWNEICY